MQTCLSVFLLLPPWRNVGRPEIYPKTDFSGDLAERARLSAFTEDCCVERRRGQILVQSSTTHPAQLTQFDDNLRRYGHINVSPAFNKKYLYYLWQSHLLLNDTFDFLIDYKKNPLRFLSVFVANEHAYVYIGSLTDAEGSVGIKTNNGYALVTFEISNNNREILGWAQRWLGGTIYRQGDNHKLRLYGEKAVTALRKLPITHREKVAAKELILHYADNGGVGLEALRAYQKLRRRIDEEVRLCVVEARLEWIRRHGRPHPNDPDQRMP